jgi:hypothetical protein
VSNLTAEEEVAVLKENGWEAWIDSSAYLEELEKRRS